jgi:biotin transport system substrate-specific component
MSQAIVAQYIDRRAGVRVGLSPDLLNVLSVLGGVALIALLAQLRIVLPFTPVPVTGQTFGVTLVALLWGRNRAVATLVSYLALGAVGAPIFTAAKSGLAFGPTLGYLVGMLFSSWVVGSLADRGWAKNFWSAWAAAAIGSLFVFTCGTAVLRFFVPADLLFAQGVLPFLPGDLIKNCLASIIVSGVAKKAVRS